MTPLDINYLAVLVAVIVQFSLGGLTYSILFRKPFMAAVGKTQEELMEGFNPARSYGVAFLSALATAFVLPHFVDYAGADTIAIGLQTGFWLWLGFVITSNLATILIEGRHPTLYYLNTGYQLAGLLIIGAILSL